MSEYEELYTIPEPTLEEQVVILERKVHDLTEQLKVEHVMTLSWKTRALAFEKAMKSAQASQGRTQGKTGTSGNGHASESILGQPDALDSLL